MNELVALLPQNLVTMLQSWDTNVLFITAASFFAWIAWRIIYGRLEILVGKTQFHWDDLTLHALKTPGQHTDLVLARDNFTWVHSARLHGV